MKLILRRCLRYILPVSCVGCGAATHELICPACRAAILSGDRCETQLPDVDRTMALVAYDGPIKALIHTAKFGPSLEAAELVASIATARGLDLTVSDYEWITPIPGSRDRIRCRGFDLPKLIFTSLVADRLHSVMFRTRDTRALFGLGAVERRDELDAVFMCLPGVIQPGDRILLVDDIVTSGATVQAAARYLRTIGAARVDVMAFAMTPKGHVNDRD